VVGIMCIRKINIFFIAAQKARGRRRGDIFKLLKP
jgi:hypothetical protein